MDLFSNLTLLSVEINLIYRLYSSYFFNFYLLNFIYNYYFFLIIVARITCTILFTRFELYFLIFICDHSVLIISLCKRHLYEARISSIVKFLLLPLSFPRSVGASRIPEAFPDKTPLWISRLQKARCRRVNLSWVEHRYYS